MKVLWHLSLPCYQLGTFLLFFCSYQNVLSPGASYLRENGFSDGHVMSFQRWRKTVLQEESSLLFYRHKLVINSDISFLPRTTLVFHLNKDFILPSFFHIRPMPLETLLHSLNGDQVLAFYLDPTTVFHLGQHLFLALQIPSKGYGLPLSLVLLQKNTVNLLSFASRWDPLPMQATSTRAAAKSAACLLDIPLLELCPSATLYQPSIFIKHFKLDCAPENAQSSAELSSL